MAVKHAVLSASSSERWLNCPPSARLCEAYEDKASDYAALEARVEAFAAELETILRGKGVPVTVNRLASMYTVFFSDGPLRNFEDVFCY